MAFIPNTQLQIRRGVTTNTYGDEVDDTVTVLVSDLEAFVQERSQRTWLATEDRLSIEQRYIVYLDPGVDVREGDKLIDQNSPDEDNPVEYEVREVTTTPGIAIEGPVTCTAVRVSGRIGSSG